MKYAIIISFNVDKDKKGIKAEKSGSPTRKVLFVHILISTYICVCNVYNIKIYISSHAHLLQY